MEELRKICQDSRSKGADTACPSGQVGGASGENRTSRECP